MPARTKWSLESTLSPPLPFEPHSKITFTFQPGSRIITFPAGSTASTGYHWHEEYTEHVSIIRGKALISIDGVEKVYGADDGILTFPRGIVHCIGRADKEGNNGKVRKEEGEDLVLQEWTDPENGFKEVFFRNLFGLLLDCQGKPGVKTVFEVLTILDWTDEYPAIVQMAPKWANKLILTGIFALTRFVGNIIGLKKWHQEYTPTKLWDVARTRGASRAI